jgi:Phosphatidylinositol 3- and 4-kinase
MPLSGCLNHLPRADIFELPDLRALWVGVQVAKIAVLDIRLANTDRNGSNILVSSGSDGTVRLTPIDHGYCLPSSLQDITFEWLYWPQASVPFSEEALAYIQALDADNDLALLEAHGIHIRPECARVFRVQFLPH